ncbi:hypothetical protein [Noviherbaspirillum suwonense]|jgi:hypothetical protein|nr:hypothetical protein [Noviherbaspirillum suwonense]
MTALVEPSATDSGFANGLIVSALDPDVANPGTIALSATLPLPRSVSGPCPLMACRSIESGALVTTVNAEFVEGKAVCSDIDVTEGSTTMVLLNVWLAFCNAWRSEPGPLSAAVVTEKMDGNWMAKLGVAAPKDNTAAKTACANTLGTG